MAGTMRPKAAAAGARRLTGRASREEADPAEGVHHQQIEGGVASDAVPQRLVRPGQGHEADRVLVEGLPVALEKGRGDGHLDGGPGLDIGEGHIAGHVGVEFLGGEDLQQDHLLAG